MADTTTERRRHERAAVGLEASIERLGGRKLAGEASTVDLSEGGARLLGPAGLAVGDVVRVAIRRGDLTVERQGLIVGRSSESPKTATLHVAFKTVDARDRGDLRDLQEMIASGVTP